MSNTLFADASGHINTVGALVKGFFISEDVSTRTPASFVCILAPVFQQNGLTDLDADVKVMVGVVNKKLADAMPNFKTFDDVQGMFNANLQIVLKLKEAPSNVIPDMLALRDRSFFDFKPGGNVKAIPHIRKWMKSDLLGDSLSLELTGLDDSEVIKSFITISGKTIDNLQTKLVVNRSESKDIVDIGIIQYPSQNSPCIKLHRVKVAVWLKQYNIGGGFTNTLETGITGIFQTFTYEPSEGITGLAEGTRIKAIEVFDRFAAQVPQSGSDYIPPAIDPGTFLESPLTAGIKGKNEPTRRSSCSNPRPTSPLWQKHRNGEPPASSAGHYKHEAGTKTRQSNQRVAPNGNKGTTVQGASEKTGQPQHRAGSALQGAPITADNAAPPRDQPPVKSEGPLSAFAVEVTDSVQQLLDDGMPPDDHLPAGEAQQHAKGILATILARLGIAPGRVAHAAVGVELGGKQAYNGNTSFESN